MCKSTYSTCVLRIIIEYPPLFTVLEVLRPTSDLSIRAVRTCAISNSLLITISQLDIQRTYDVVFTYLGLLYYIFYCLSTSFPLGVYLTTTRTIYTSLCSGLLSAIVLGLLNIFSPPRMRGFFALLCTVNLPIKAVTQSESLKPTPKLFCDHRIYSVLYIWHC